MKCDRSGNWKTRPVPPVSLTTFWPLVVPRIRGLPWRKKSLSIRQHKVNIFHLWRELISAKLASSHIIVSIRPRLPILTSQAIPPPSSGLAGMPSVVHRPPQFISFETDKKRGNSKSNRLPASNFFIIEVPLQPGLISYRIHRGCAWENAGIQRRWGG